MKHPEKWRDSVNPFDLKLKKFKLEKILGYPHAGNDVFHATGKLMGEEKEVYIKVSRQKDSDILNEVNTILKSDYELFPSIIEFDYNYLITLAKKGERLSYILQNHNNEKSKDYLFTYGKNLAIIHGFKGDYPKIKDRKFFYINEDSYYRERNLDKVLRFLKNNKPNTINSCFCHGDFHYANVLWRRENKEMTAVLDLELSGIGNREFDIAWTIILRPEQKFLDTDEEMMLFLEGYSSIASFDIDLVKYYMILIYSYFIDFSTDISYKNHIYAFFKRHCTK